MAKTTKRRLRTKTRATPSAALLPDTTETRMGTARYAYEHVYLETLSEDMQFGNDAPRRCPQRSIKILELTFPSYSLRFPLFSQLPASPWRWTARGNGWSRAMRETREHDRDEPTSDPGHGLGVQDIREFLAHLELAPEFGVEWMLDRLGGDRR